MTEFTLHCNCTEAGSQGVWCRVEGTSAKSSRKGALLTVVVGKMEEPQERRVKR